jgi:hypothetical protein
MEVASTTNTSIFVVPCFTAAQAYQHTDSVYIDQQKERNFKLYTVAL